MPLVEFTMTIDPSEVIYHSKQKVADKIRVNLYLDKQVVEEAKKLNLNISQVTSLMLRNLVYELRRK